MTLVRILHVEDDPDIQAVTRLSLVDVGGFELHQCAHGKQALTDVPEFQPQLLLLDLMLPDLSGEEVWQQVRTLPGYEQVPAIFLTACVQRDLERRLRALGALDVMHKPFEPLQIASRIRERWTAWENGLAGLPKFPAPRPSATLHQLFGVSPGE